MRLLRCALLLLTPPICACAQVPAPATHLTLSIEDRTGAHVPSASIQIERPSDDMHIIAKSDSEGRFSIDLQPGSYVLSVASPGFYKYQKPLGVVTAPSQQTQTTLDVLGYSGPVVDVVDPAIPIPTLSATLDSLVDASTPLEIKVVVITMFEPGADTGDTPGEFQYWVEREHLDTILHFPQGYHDLRMNSAGVLGLVTGVGTARAAATLMALGTDPRFDLTHAYFLVAGIAGIDPEMGSLGSAVWSDFIVDGDLAHEIDAREIPPTWPTGYVPLGKSTPYEQPRADRFPTGDGTVYRLNPALVSWAYNLTKDTPLPDTPGIAARRMQFAGAAAHRPPFVLRGDNLSAATFWHGKLLNAWARAWVKYQTGGQGTYAVCGMEDTGTLQSLTWLAKAHKVDLDRVLVLRTASNYDQQREGITAAASLAETKITQYSAYLPALDTAYRVGHLVVDTLVQNWPQTRNQIPTH